MTHTFVLVEFKHRECFTSDGRLFAKHQTLSYWCWIFSSWSRSRKLGVYQFQRFFVYCCHNNIDFTKTYIFNKFQSIVNHWWKFCSDQARVKSLLKRFKNIGTVSEKVYRNTLNSVLRTIVEILTYEKLHTISTMRLLYFEYLALSLWCTYQGSMTVIVCH